GPRDCTRSCWGSGACSGRRRSMKRHAHSFDRLHEDALGNNNPLTPSRALARLREVPPCPCPRVSDSLKEATCTIDEAGPFAVVRPTSVAEVGDLVRRAIDQGHALFPLGGRTLLDVGLPPDRAGVGVDLRDLSEVIDYPARDMTVTVQPGITLARLEVLLATERQRLPVDVPQPDRATLGGALAVNASGPRRYGFGTLRDYVIGMTVVNDEGHEAKAGGRVVKNVAGYDLPKLHVGALGTLGIIVQVTLKLRPLPEESALLVLRCEPGGLADLLDRLHAT